MKTPLSASEWPVERPEEDFARRTLAVLLEEGGEGFSGARLEVPRRRRWPLVLLAALSVSATAWGAWQLGRREAPAASVAEVSEEAGSDPPAWGSSSPKPTVEAEPAAPAPATEISPRPPLPRRTTRAVSQEEEPKEAPGERPFLTPPCECGPGGIICSCVE